MRRSLMCVAVLTVGLALPGRVQAQADLIVADIKVYGNTARVLIRNISPNPTMVGCPLRVDVFQNGAPFAGPFFANVPALAGFQSTWVSVASTVPYNAAGRKSRFHVNPPPGPPVFESNYGNNIKYYP